MTPKQRSDIRRKLNVFAYASKAGNITKACRHYGISKTTFYMMIPWEGTFNMLEEDLVVPTTFPMMGAKH